MKMKKLLMALLLMSVIAISVSAVAAEQAQIGQNTFDVPDGYTIVQTEDNMIMMQIDENNAVTVTIDIPDDIESSKQTILDQWYELVNESTVQYADKDINVQGFTKDDITSYNYIVLSDDGNYVVGVVSNDPNFDGDLESGSNPAATIFDTWA